MRNGAISTRLATVADAEAIAAIYSEGIADRIATFETEPRTAERIAAQLADKGDRGTGAGRAALEALCRAYTERGFWKLVSRIFVENTASLALHERSGFRVVGVYHRHGKLGDEFHDCVIVEKLLG